MNKFFDLFIPQGCLQSCIHLQHKVNINHGVLGSINLTEAEDIKKRWQEYTEELYKKELHDPDNHDDVITHLEPDILECEVKWALLRKHHYEQS